MRNYINKFTEKYSLTKKYSKANSNLDWIIPSIVLFSILLLYFCVIPDTQNLIAHDEGLYARRAKLILETNDWFTPFVQAHHKTVGSYWLIAFSFKVFGNNEFAARFPSIILSFVCLFLVYSISSEIFNRRVGLLSSSLLFSTPLWIQYSRYASPDIPYLLLILLSNYFIIKASNYIGNIRSSCYYFFFAFSLSLAFFIRSYMVFIPILAIFPFCFLQIRNSPNKAHFWMIPGLIIGLIPTYMNLILANDKYGLESISLLFNFAKEKAIDTTSLDSFLFATLKFVYLSYPVSIIFIILILFTKTKPNNQFYYLTHIYPLIILFLLSIMSNTYPHYYLILLPSLSIIVARYIDVCYTRKRINNIYRYFIIVFFLITITLLLAIALLINNTSIVSSNEKYIVTSILVSLAFFHVLSIIYLFKYKKITLHSLSKVAFLLSFPQLLSLSFLYNIGIIGNPNKNIKPFINDSLVSDIISINNVYLYNLSSKTKTLLGFYLPRARFSTIEPDFKSITYMITADKTLISELQKKDFQVKIISSFDNNYLIRLN